MTDSRKFGSAVLATVSIADKHLDVWTRVANAMNKQNPSRANAMAKLLEQVLGNLDAVVDQTRPKTLAERYEAFTPELKAKLFFENGRLYFFVVGTGLPSASWPKRLKDSGHVLEEYSADILSKPDYDKKHRLEDGKVYKLGIILGTEIAIGKERSTSRLGLLGRQKIGVHAVDGLKAEFALLIREKFTNTELEEMGLWYIAVLHEPIVVSDGVAYVLRSARHGGASYVRASYGDLGNRWGDSGAFAFFASA